MIKELTLSKFVQFYLYSILNQRDKLFREKMSTKYYFWKEEKCSASIKKEKDFHCFTVAIFQLSRNQQKDLIGRIV